MRGGRLSIAYIHYGAQSGVTPAVAHELLALGHDVRLVAATGTLEPRDALTRRLRPTAEVARHLAAAALRFGRRAVVHRWSTCYAFDRHALAAGEGLSALRPAPDLVLQNGAIFSPGLPPRLPYALLLDHTRALAQAGPAWPSAGLPAPADYGTGWFARESALYRGAALLACFSENVARSLVSDYGVDPARVAVVGAGANVFPEKAVRRDDGRTVAFVGKDFARKGGPVLLEAFARLRRAVPKVRLVVAGALAPPRRRIPPDVFFLGQVSTSEVASLLSQATVFALPTLREPYGIAFLDAMACGLPCVGTRIEAVPEIVRDGETGFLVPPGDPAALALAIERLLRDPVLARAMGARGRARVFAGALWSHVAARLERALEGAVAGRGRAA